MPHNRRIGGRVGAQELHILQRLVHPVLDIDVGIVVYEQHAQIPVIPVVQGAEQADAGEHGERERHDDLGENPPFAGAVYFAGFNQLGRH
ncbi:hypothetical protein D3C81_2047240 [compost metagenome]